MLINESISNFTSRCLKDFLELVYYYGGTSLAKAMKLHWKKQFVLHSPTFTIFFSFAKFFILHVCHYFIYTNFTFQGLNFINLWFIRVTINMSCINLPLKNSPWGCTLNNSTVILGIITNSSPALSIGVSVGQLPVKLSSNTLCTFIFLLCSDVSS